jgi:hypothetical protein
VYGILGGAKGAWQEQRIMFLRKVKENQSGTGFLYITELEVVRDRMSYIVLRGYWFNIIVLNVHAPSEEKSNDSKDSICEKLGQVLIIFLGTIGKFC